MVTARGLRTTRPSTVPYERAGGCAGSSIPVGSGLRIWGNCLVLLAIEGGFSFNTEFGSCFETWGMGLPGRL